MYARERIFKAANSMAISPRERNVEPETGEFSTNDRMGREDGEEVSPGRSTSTCRDQE